MDTIKKIDSELMTQALKESEKMQTCQYCGKPYVWFTRDLFSGENKKTLKVQVPNCKCIELKEKEEERQRILRHKSERLAKLFDNSMMTPFFKEKKFFIILRGNCDYITTTPLNDVRSLGSYKVYASHGATENVKYSLDGIKRAALSNGCNIALFGHTHQKYYCYEDGLHIFNPGSIKEGSYGVIDITDSGVLCFHKNLWEIK